LSESYSYTFDSKQKQGSACRNICCASHIGLQLQRSEIIDIEHTRFVRDEMKFDESQSSAARDPAIESDSDPTIGE
jgi:hypothetical protein